MTLARDPDEVRRVIAEAEAIRDGQDPPGASTPLHVPGGAEGEAPRPPGDASPSPSFPPGHLAGLAVILTDMLFVRLFRDPGAAMQEPLRTEAVKAWEAVIVTYAPVIQHAGPAGALAACYGAHLLSLYAMRVWATSESLSGQSGEAAAEKPPSSAS